MGRRLQADRLGIVRNISRTASGCRLKKGHLGIGSMIWTIVASNIRVWLLVHVLWLKLLEEQRAGFGLVAFI